MPGWSEYYLLGILARVLATTIVALLGLSVEKAATNRDRLIDQIEAALSRLSDSDLELIAVQVRALTEWRNS